MITPRSMFALMTSLVFVGCGTEADQLERDVAGAVNQVITHPTAAQHKNHDVVERSYIVAFRAPASAVTRPFASFAEEYRHHTSLLDDRVTADTRVKGLRFLTKIDLANPKEPSKQAELAPPKALQLAWTENQLDPIPGSMTVVNFDSQESANAALAEWDAQGLIWYAEPNYVNRLMDNPYTASLAAAYTKANAWWHTTIKLPQALNRLAASQLDGVIKPVVAVLDSGLDVQNQYIKDNVWANPSPGASGCANDQYGCDTTVAAGPVLGTGDVFPYTTSAYGTACPGDGSSDPDAAAEAGVCGHGTHVSGIIAAAVGDGSAGIGGVCPVCQIMPIKIITKIEGSGAASDEAILAGFKYLTLFKNVVSNQAIVRVANSSFGKYTRDRSVALIVSVLKKPPNEVLVVGAAGNEDSMLRSYPAALTDAVAVAAIGPKMEKAIYSNFGPWVSVSAPGGNAATSDDTGNQIESTVPGTSGTGYKQGTSMACPVVAGTAGLVLSYDPGRSWQDLRNSIIFTADVAMYDVSVNQGINLNYYYPKLSGSDERHPLLGSGIVDAQAALDNASITGYLPPDTNRVSAACGRIGGPAGGRGRDAASLLLLLVAPAAALWRPRRRAARAPAYQPPAGGALRLPTDTARAARAPAYRPPAGGAPPQSAATREAR